jgi:site-specific recombinase XerD
MARLRLPKYEGDVMTLSDLATRYAREIIGDGASRNTEENYNRYFARFIAFILGRGGQNSVRELTDDNLRAYFAWLRDEGQIGPNTIRNAMSAFSSLAQFAMRTPQPHGKGYLLDSNPITRIKRPKHVPPKIDWLTFDELMAMVRVAADRPHHERLAFALVADKPLRASEWCAANVSDLIPTDGDRVAIQVMVKGGKQRVNVLGVKVGEMLMATLRQREAKPGEPLIVNWEGKRFTRQNFSDVINRVARLAGIKREVRAHRIRHTVASLMAQNGASEHEIAAMLNHSSTATAKVYIHGVKPDAALDRVRDQVWG